MAETGLFFDTSFSGRGVISCADSGIDRIDNKEKIYIKCFVFILIMFYIWFKVLLGNHPLPHKEGRG